MKKVAILTHPLRDNIGGILQAASLYTYLSKCGYDVTLLRKHFIRRKLPFITRIGRFLLENTPFQNRKGYRHRAMKRRSNDMFVKDLIPGSTEILYTKEQIADILDRDRFAAIIVGSDQVWRMKYIDDGEYTSYFLDFPKYHGMRKIAYAASFGTDEWEAPERISQVKALLDDFDSISVRESSGLEICKGTFGIDNCELTIDPTLLVDRNFFSKLMTTPPESANKKLVTYILDPNPTTEDAVGRLAELLGEEFKIKHLIGDRRVYSIKEWLGELAFADYVITDSFHGMVFAIAFGKPFIVMGNRDRGMARFYSLLNLVGLTSRLVSTATEMGTAFESSIDYSAIDKKIFALRKSSISFLETALS